MTLSDEAAPIPHRVKRPLAALWISLGLHAMVIALVQVVPVAETGSRASVIEARLVPVLVGDRVVPVPADALAALADLTDANPAADAIGMTPVIAQPQPALPEPVASLPPHPDRTPTPPLPALVVTSAVDLTYYSAREVDVLPRAQRDIMPVFPQDAGRLQLSGKVVLQLKLEADGRVSAIEVISADPPGVFDEAALQAFRDARFEPGMKQGRPVRMVVRVPVEFSATGSPR